MTRRTFMTMLASAAAAFTFPFSLTRVEKAKRVMIVDTGRTHLFISYPAFNGEPMCLMFERHEARYASYLIAGIAYASNCDRIEIDSAGIGQCYYDFLTETHANSLLPPSIKDKWLAGRKVIATCRINQSPSATSGR